MISEEQEDERIYKVVVNHEEQYSIWFADREIPSGWKDVGKEGKKSECLDYIKEVWTDMRPLSLRREMAALESKPLEQMPDRTPDAVSEPPDPRDSLVDFLCDGDHPVEASLRPENSTERLKDCVERGYLHIKFTDTRGGTELGIQLDRDSIDSARARFAEGSGTTRLAGELTLNYRKVRCVAVLDILTCSGKGHLEAVEEA